MMRLFSTLTHKPPIQITTAAWTKMSEIIKKKDASPGFFFSAKSGGCNGFNYDLKLITPTETKTLKNLTVIVSPIKIANVFIDPMSEMFLLGTTIDYVTEDYDKGNFESRFIFIPDKKMAAACGCGISFTPRHSPKPILK
jgi:iron-sulfur cluster assembly accessory protein